MMAIVVADTKKDAIELVKVNVPNWKDTKLNASVMCDDIRDGFVSDPIDLM